MPNMLTQTYNGRSGHDTMQVCLSGHQITAFAVSAPEFRKAFCEQCGEKTIDACPSCQTAIRGKFHTPNSFSTRKVPVPAYCAGCGAAYPWQQSAMENLREILSDDDQLSEADRDVAEGAISDIVRETPKTEGAALRMRRVLSKLSKPTYDVAIKVITDIASEAGKKAMGL